MKNGYLRDLHFEGVVTGLDLSLVNDTRLTDYGRDFKVDELSEAVNTERVTSDRQRALAFCVDRAHTQAVFEFFRAKGISCGYVDSETPAPERKEVLTRFANGEIRVMFNILVLTEGYDCPPIDCILLARPSKSPSLLTQMIGRGTRIADSKGNCIIIDVVHSHRINDMLTNNRAVAGWFVHKTRRVGVWALRKEPPTPTID